MSVHDVEPRPRPFRWTGPCSGCRREDELETRYDHGARALCDRCAGQPPPLVTPDPALADVSDDQLRRLIEATWDADTAAPMPAPPRRSPDWIGRTLTVAEVAAWCESQHLRPVIDGDLEAVHADCPTCRAQDDDPRRLWRPRTIAPREGRIYIYCQGCDKATVQLRLLRPPTEAEAARQNAQRMKGEGR